MLFNVQESFIVMALLDVEKIIEINLNDEESLEFKKSIDSVNGLIDACKGIDTSLA